MDKKRKVYTGHFIYLNIYYSLQNLKGLYFSSNSSSWSLKTDDFMVKSHLKNYNGPIVNWNICPAHSECNSSQKLKGRASCLILTLLS